MSNDKTNAMRILDRAKVSYTAQFYDVGKEGFTDGVQIAEKLGLNPSEVYKTLVTVSNKKLYYVFVIPVDKELDLKSAAKSVGEKSVEMIKVSDINKVTGYIRGGCSPVGMKKQYTTVIHEDVEALDKFYVSGGKIGCQLELSPKDLKSVVNYHIADIIHH